MIRRAAGAALGLAAVVALAAGAAAPEASARPRAISVQAERGEVATAVAALGRGGLKVQRRRGAQLQVVADPARARALSRLPGVAGARVASAAFADAAAVSQGVERSGADVLGRVASGGDGVVIAVLDLGFGQNLATQQARGELPPAGRLETLSFDAAGGLAGSNAYGNRTNHGELVAQTVFDYAPQARYLLVNYHTESDFLAAVDTLIARRVDIVVHSNSFIEGPFDGTSPSARAVNRAAAAGILWFNSAGNYAQLSWGGEWDDADGDGDLDWPNGDGWTFPRAAGLPITFALSWTSPPGGPATDIDLVLERQDASGAWIPVMGSSDRQSAGAPPSERITGYSPPADGTFRLRAVLQSGPPPVGPLTLFSREIGLGDIGGTAVSSLPTPGDAAGAVSVGAVNWRGDGFKAYSSQGPTDDGRVKPDVVAPTDTRLMGPNGLRSVGGTSIAAPNAAGAAAVLLAAERRAGRFPSAGGGAGPAHRARGRPRRPRSGHDLRRRAGAGEHRRPTPRRDRAGPAQLGAREGHGPLHGAVALAGHAVVAAPRRDAGRAPGPDLPARHQRRHPPACRTAGTRCPSRPRTSPATSGRATGRSRWTTPARSWWSARCGSPRCGGRTPGPGRGRAAPGARRG